VCINTGKPWAGVQSGLDGVERWVSVMAFRGAMSRHDSPSIQIPIAITSSPLISQLMSPKLCTQVLRAYGVGAEHLGAVPCTRFFTCLNYLEFHFENCFPFKGDRIVR
jgi:hypothetical protein